jgi:hypothetical protein
MNGDFQLAPNLSEPFLASMEQHRTRFSLLCVAPIIVVAVIGLFCIQNHGREIYSFQKIAVENTPQIEECLQRVVRGISAPKYQQRVAAFSLISGKHPSGTASDARSHRDPLLSFRSM